MFCEKKCRILLSQWMKLWHAFGFGQKQRAGNQQLIDTVSVRCNWIAQCFQPFGSVDIALIAHKLMLKEVRDLEAVSHLEGEVLENDMGARCNGKFARFYTTWWPSTVELVSGLQHLFTYLQPGRCCCCTYTGRNCNCSKLYREVNLKILDNNSDQLVLLKVRRMWNT